MARVHACKPEVSDVCPKCGKAAETCSHRYRNCEANDDLGETCNIVRYTEDLAERALEDTDQPCLWHRALLPQSMHVLEAPVQWHCNCRPSCASL